MKDHCLQYETTISGGGNHKSALSDCESETLLLYRTRSDGSLAKLEKTESDLNGDGDDTRNDMDPLVKNAKVMTLEESPLLLR